MLVLDTNMLIELSNRNQNIITFLKDQLEKFPTRPHITAFSYSEFLYGFIKKNPKKEDEAITFLKDYNVLHTSQNSSKILAKIKYALEKKGTMIPLFDILIASIVLDRGATLVTMDEHFQKVDGLRVIVAEQGG